MTSAPDFAEALAAVRAGHAERICSPGQWRVWREGGDTHFEHLEGVE